MKNNYSSFKYVAFITQLGLQLVVPILLCLFVAVYLRDKFSLGNWVVIVGILLGISSAFYSLAGFIKFATKKAKESEQERDNY